MRIIIVEDRQLWQGIISGRVAEAFDNSAVSAKPTVFGSFNPASEALSKNPPWHLLITDYSLTEQGNDALGAELCHDAKQLGIPSIVISDKPQLTPEIVRDLFTIHNVLDVYLKTNFKINEFKDAVRREIEKADEAQKAIRTHFRQNDAEDSIATFIEKSNTRQLYEICNLLELLSPTDESDNDLIEYLDSTKEVLTTIHGRLSVQNNTQMAEAVKDIEKVVESNILDIKHSVKLTVPIIPFILTYHGVLDATTKVRLEILWKRLKDRFRRNL
jgi:hypothetical protein